MFYEPAGLFNKMLLNNMTYLIVTVTDVTVMFLIGGLWKPFKCKYDNILGNPVLQRGWEGKGETGSGKKERGGEGKGKRKGEALVGSLYRSFFDRRANTISEV